MMLKSFLMLVLSITLYNIFSEVNSAGLIVEKPSHLNENDVEETKTPMEYFNNFNYKIEVMTQILNKMDISLQSLQEKSNTWAIFQHHINSWNEGIRILENKLDLLKQTNEEQHQQMQKLEFYISGNNKINELSHNGILEDLKQYLFSERKHKNEILSKINNILKQIQLTAVCNERKSVKKSNIMAPIDDLSKSQQCLNTSNLKKVEQHLNTLSNQMALQKDLKQLNNLEKRNSKNLETINQALRNQLDKHNEIILRLQKSNECCYSVSNELTTFTESSDTLLKRIEILVRNVSDRLNDIEVKKNAGDEHNGADDDDNDDNIAHESEETDINFPVTHFNNFNGVEERKELQRENSNSRSNVTDFEQNVTEQFEFDDSHDVEFLRPNLSGCHDLLDELIYADTDDDSARIDGIYKFSQPNINVAERDFNERYCVFPKSPNDTALPWTVIQRRGPYHQQENFNRSWSEYRNGFGHLSRDFWFGNEFIHRLVYYDDYELRIELEDFDGIQSWAEYSIFRIDSEEYNYNLLIGNHRGTIGDAMNYHNDNDFSTYDKRNDKTIDACCSCAMGYASGWWFDNCSEANLNGIYHNTPLGHNYIGIMWELWRGDYSLKKTRMMIRPHIKKFHISIEDSEEFHEYTEDP